MAMDQRRTQLGPALFGVPSSCSIRHQVDGSCTPTGSEFVDAADEGAADSSLAKFFVDPHISKPWPKALIAGYFVIGEQ